MVFAFQSSGSLMSNSRRSRSRGMRWDRVMDAFCAGQMRRQELSGSVQGRGRFVEDRVIGLEDVRHSGGDIEGDLHVGGGRLPGEADGVVEDDLVGYGPRDHG